MKREVLSNTEAQALVEGRHAYASNRAHRISTGRAAGCERKKHGGRKN